MIKFSVKPETTDDHKAVFDVIQAAFAKVEESDHREQFLVERIRKSEVFVPELSLVAKTDGKIVGHILLTPIRIVNGQEQFSSLALAPVSVLPAYQRMGIGRALIEAGHHFARLQGYGSIVLLGHASYYPQLGYSLAEDFGITLPFDVPSENCFAIELEKDALQDITGTVVYPEAFTE